MFRRRLGRRIKELDVAGVFSRSPKFSIGRRNPWRKAGGGRRRREAVFGGISNPFDRENKSPEVMESPEVERDFYSGDIGRTK